MKKTLGWVLLPTNTFASTTDPKFIAWLDKAKIYPTREKARQNNWKQGVRVERLVLTAE